MRMKRITLLTLALLVMSVTAFAQNATLQAYTYSFSQSMNGWTTIDADDDGYEWFLITDKPTILGHDGQPGLATSASYFNTVLYPDNYLVSPKMKLDGSITFWACAQDASWAADHFGVAVSTTGNTNPSDFIMLDEWTMTASRSLAPRRVQGKWYEYEIDLSSFEGAEGYVAIRHYNCNDMFRLNVDDITLTTTELKDEYDPDLEKPELVIVYPPAGLATEDWTVARYYHQGDDIDNDNKPGVAEEKVLQVGFDGNDVYVHGFSYYSNYIEEDSENWIKGTLSDDGKSITFASGQYYGSYSGDMYSFFFAAYDLNTSSLAPVTVAYDAEAGTMTWPTDVLIIENGTFKGTDEMYGYFTEITAMVKGVAPNPLAAPDIVTAEYLFKAKSLSTDGQTGELVTSDYNRRVQVGIGINEIYVKGLCEDMPDSWIKGTFDSKTNLATFPTGQHFGTYDPWEGTGWAGYDVQEFFFAGYGENGLEDVVMAFNEDTGVFTMVSPAYMLINAYWLLPEPYQVFEDVELVPIPDVAAIPALPEIIAASQTGDDPYISVNIPVEDEDGNPILTSKLSYQYYYEVGQEVTPLTLTPNEYPNLDEEMTEIPYGFTSTGISQQTLYLNMDFSNWRRVGIQSIYRGGGKENRSEIFWYAMYDYKLTVPAQSYATFYIDDAVTIDAADAEAGAELYTVTEVNNNAVVISPIDAADSQTPMLVYNGSDKKMKIRLIPTDAPTAETVPAAEFKGTLEEQEMGASNADTDYFVCDGTAFFKVNQSGTIAANKCWLEVSKDTPVSARLNIVLNGSEATGITGMNQNENENQYYDLQGRRVAQPAKGFYILNGKKVVVK
ncbi:MAG: choice-of-anchor J domain-containing protein [Prevotella sp.]|nr:choice-of-anchor J domain-containing protein [Prevotella sp.]